VGWGANAYYLPKVHKKILFLPARGGRRQGLALAFPSPMFTTCSGGAQPRFREIMSARKTIFKLF